MFNWFVVTMILLIFFGLFLLLPLMNWWLEYCQEIENDNIGFIVFTLPIIIPIALLAGWLTAVQS